MLSYLKAGMANPESPAVADADGAWTYGDLARAVGGCANRLLGGRASLEGERVGVVMAPERETVAAFFAVLAAGGIAVPVATQAAPPEIAYEIDEAGMARLIAGDAFREKVTAALALSQAEPAVLSPPGLMAGISGDLGVSETDASLLRASRRSDGAATPVQHQPPSVRDLLDPPLGAPALMLFTSGTTGRPKGVIHTHASLQNQVEVLREAWQWQAGDRLLHVLPLHHIHGLVNGMVGALWAGASLRFLPRFNAADAWAALAGGEVSVLYAVPTIYHLLVEAWRAAPVSTQEAWADGTRRLRLAVSGSAALPPSLFEGWRGITGQALLERYGMSETGMNISNPYAGERRPGTVGQPLPTMDIRLVGEDGVDAAPGEGGEIWIKGPSLFRGYWRRPDATAAAFRDGYFLTGDIAVVEDGYYRILGRATSDIIKSAGYKLSALEIEAVLSEHPAVSEVAVVGVPSVEWGEVVTACVVARDGADLDLAQVRAWCTDRLSAYKHPRRLEIMPELPRNAMGKVLKASLVEGLAAVPP